MRGLYNESNGLVVGVRVWWSIKWKWMVKIVSKVKWIKARMDNNFIKMHVRNYRKRIKKMRIFFILWISGKYDYSLNLSRNRKIESKIKSESAYITNAKYSINVYKFNMKRDFIKIRNGKNGTVILYHFITHSSHYHSFLNSR